MNPNRPASRFGQTLEQVSRWATRWAGSSWAFSLAVLVIVVWLVTGPIFHFSDTWQLVINTGTTIVTFLMVFLIQRAQNKDGLAIQLKLNEIVAALDGASNRERGGAARPARPLPGPRPPRQAGAGLAQVPLRRRGGAAASPEDAGGTGGEASGLPGPELIPRPGDGFAEGAPQGSVEPFRSGPTRRPSGGRVLRRPRNARSRRALSTP
jgi:hypothetical protein